MQEIAALVSQALEAAGITAVLGGGGAVSQYTDNDYMTTDLDIITVERNKVIALMVARRQDIDWNDVYAWAASESLNDEIVDEVRGELGLADNQPQGAGP